MFNNVSLNAAQNTLLKSLTKLIESYNKTQCTHLCIMIEEYGPNYALRCYTGFNQYVNKNVNIWCAANGITGCIC